MEVNVECVRDVLKIVADKPFGQYINSDNLGLSNIYSKELIESTVQALYESNLIKVENEYLLNCDLDYSIGELTKEGCALLTSLKDDANFKKIKDSLNHHTSHVTIRALQRLAANYDRHIR
ncbi:hypothetical protein FC19_GL000763 [Liquorilactobacillus aquaticus DSM 21051]|uniref:DUF2513 domain-containing protein n=1 Tax=Liquorilactobacillus aquaticus DSM 21051 TaxID=1423725 RepID=A0A0R2CYA7_9LACO|nr:DUF2513 domain-containing protein [Liquorilactobacillus aquaticus]KRM96469.1 hypothetical protein FC19_GL000763 [Liquorilactobacillus aquaticus DSM 21051]